MTLLRAGECIRFEYDGLVCGQYTYGRWAGRQSPYLGLGLRRELLTYNPTDLEYHDFPHVFFSRRRSLPLVVSVARWRPYAHEISLADLWLAPGDALVLPPQRFPEQLPPGALEHDAWMAVTNLHSNRNSALARRFQGGENGLTTETILGNAEVMRPRPRGRITTRSKRRPDTRSRRATTTDPKPDSQPDPLPASHPLRHVRPCNSPAEISDKTCRASIPGEHHARCTESRL
ncbi:hypothetical protein [Burkholderia ubonensis]|uniref:hypothetical protein n=1 Tax=Burkholderia ubonensis TaxID=101571 RepID=UPI000B02557F|nr:hypothetical protein [Burkholderia ubonensis]